jgi:hypothetical protein
MTKGLRVTIEGERGAISLDTFATVIRNTFDILADLDSAVSFQPQGSAHWFVVDASFGSLVIAIEPKSKLRDIDYSPKVAEAFVSGLAHIQREHTTPPYFSDYGLRKIQGLAKSLGKDGAKAVIVQDVERQASAMIRPEVTTDISQLINIRYQEIGSVEGRLEMVSIHGVPRFTVYHAITQRSIRCKFALKEFLDVVKEALGRRVIVAGTVHCNYKYEPVRVDLQKLTILRKEEELPSAKELRGMIPDFTSDQTTEEYIRSIRE